MWYFESLVALQRQLQQRNYRRVAPSRRRSRRTLRAELLESRCVLSGLSAISGEVFQDHSADGIDSDDSPLANWAIHLYRDNGDGVLEPASDALVAQQQTLADGSYRFDDLPDGVYFIQQQLPIDWIQTAPAAHIHDDPIVTQSQAGPVLKEKNDTLALAIPTSLNSANPGRFIASGVIGDNPKVKELDVDIYKLQLNAGDVIHVDVDAVAFGSPLDAALRLFDQHGRQIAANDDLPGDSEDPALSFVAKSSGAYYVGVSGFANGAYNPQVEGSGALAMSTGPYTIEISVGPREGAEPVAVTLAGADVSGIDLAATQLGSIAGQVIEDLNGNGIQDEGEPGQNGQLVVLQHDGVFIDFQQTRTIDWNGDGVIDPATEAGWYLFENVEPGLYFTRTLASFGLAPDWIQTLPSRERTASEIIGQVSSGPPVDPVPAPGLLPDLTVNLETGLGDWFVAEGILHFGQATPNIGSGPMELRAGDDLGNGTQVVLQRIFQDVGETSWIDRDAGFFAFHPEHNHIHFDEYATFTLREALPDADDDGMPEVGAPVTEALKRSFCLVDVAPFDLSLPNADPDGSGLGCDSVQRISVGWEDIYGPFTSGQQIDVRGLPEGQYWLEAVVDPFNRLVEANENNNVGRVLITIDGFAPSAPQGLQPVSITSGQAATDADFGNFRKISIGGQVYEDRDADGVQQPRDNGESGVVVFLDLNGDGVLNNAAEGDNVPSALASEPWAITDKHGNFAFTGLGPGTYAVRTIAPSGWTQTTADPVAFTARSGVSVSGVKFGISNASNAQRATSSNSDAHDAAMAEYASDESHDLNWWSIIADELDPAKRKRRLRFSWSR